MEILSTKCYHSFVEPKFQKLAKFLEKREDVEAAFIFGSYAKGKTHRESDLDIAVYFKPEGQGVEFEEDKEYAGESEIWSEIERITDMNTDLVVLNRAPATLADAITREGKVLVMKDPKRFGRFLDIASDASDYYRDFMDDFIKIKGRSNSLTAIDRERLNKAAEFLESEMKEYERLSKIDQSKYQNDRDSKKILERWVENIVNSSIDIAKIILASEGKLIPASYKAILENLIEVGSFDLETAKRLGNFAKLRNILAHQYLDLRFKEISNFRANSKPSYEYLLSFTKDFIKKNSTSIN